MSCTTSFGVIGQNIDQKITNWESGGFSGWTDTTKKEAYEKILNKLKKDFQYNGNDINKEMKMKTTISIVDKSQIWYTYINGKAKYKYTIRIRNRK